MRTRLSLMFLNVLVVGSLATEDSFAGNGHGKRRKKKEEKPQSQICRSENTQVEEVDDDIPIFDAYLPTTQLATENSPNIINRIEVELPDVLIHVLMRIDIYNRHRLCLVSQTWCCTIRSAYREDGLILGTTTVQELPFQPSPRRDSVRPYVNVGRTYDFVMNGFLYHLLQRFSVQEFTFSLSEECVCRSICLIHSQNKHYERGRGSVGGTISWFGHSEAYKLFFIASGTSLFVYSVENAPVTERQEILNSETFYLENAPFHFLRRIEVGHPIDLGRVRNRVLLLFSGVLNFVVLMDLTKFRVNFDGH